MLGQNTSQKPPLGTQLNRSHPLSRGLVRAFVFNELSGKMVSGSFSDVGVLNNTTHWVKDALEFSHANNVYEADGILCGQGWFPTLQGTIVTKVYYTGGDTAYYYLIADSCGYSDWNPRIGVGAIPNNNGRFLASYNGDYLIYDSAYFIGLNVDVNVAFSWKENDYGRFYKNGNLIRSQAMGANSYPVSSFVNIGSYRGSSDIHSCYSWAGKIYFMYVYNIVLNQNQIQNLMREPYAMFYPFQRQYHQIPTPSSGLWVTDLYS